MDFHKYIHNGAYHWRNVDLTNWKTYNPVVAGRYEYSLKLLPTHADNILDIGSGDSYLIHKLALCGKRTWGIDSSIDGLVAGKLEHANFLEQYLYPPELLCASLFEMPFKSKRFDYILFSEIIEHIEDVENAMKEIKRVLTPKGMVVLSTPNRLTTGVRDFYHVREFSPFELYELLSQFFDSVTIHGLGTTRFLWWHKRLLKNRIWRKCMHLCCKAGRNPFSIPQENASKSSNLLFAVCHA